MTPHSYRPVFDLLSNRLEQLLQSRSLNYLYGTHLDALDAVICALQPSADDNLLEIGGGDWSTPLLLATGARVTTLEQGQNVPAKDNAAWLAHLKVTYGDHEKWSLLDYPGKEAWRSAKLPCDILFAFVDGNGDVRKEIVEHLLELRVPVIAAHDSENPSFRYGQIECPTGYHIYDFRGREVWTRVWCSDSEVSDALERHMDFVRLSGLVTSGEKLAGFWRWCDSHVAELRQDGTFIQHKEANREMRFGRWEPTPYGFDLEIHGCWRKWVRLDDNHSGTFHIQNQYWSSVSGHIRRVDEPTGPPEREFLNCDSYRKLISDRTIFVHTDSVLKWHESCRPEDRYILITAHSDSPIDTRHLPVLNDEKLVTWYAMNPTVSHPKLRPIPVGVCNHFSLTGFPTVAMPPARYDQLLKGNPKDKMFHVSFATSTNRKIREGCLRATGLENVPMERGAYLEDMGRSMFCISPEGNGIDCHRVWEALYCRTIPVITRNPMVGMGLYDGLPVVILESWEEFDVESFTPERYAEIWGDFDPKNLTLERFIPNPTP